MDWLRSRQALFGGEHFGAGLTVSPSSEHPFTGPEAAAIVGEVETLEHEADASAAVACAFFLLQSCHRLSVEPALTGVGVVEKSEDVQQCGLSAAARSHYGYELSVVHVYTNAVQCYGFHFFRAEDFHEVCLPLPIAK